jgi:hypothetical protein
LFVFCISASLCVVCQCSYGTYYYCVCLSSFPVFILAVSFCWVMYV